MTIVPVANVPAGSRISRPQLFVIVVVNPVVGVVFTSERSHLAPTGEYRPPLCMKNTSLPSTAWPISPDGAYRPCGGVVALVGEKIEPKTLPVDVSVPWTCVLVVVVIVLVASR